MPENVTLLLRGFPLPVCACLSMKYDVT